ncbi:unnamed protein product [Microthlaspi erraticum]|uniref:Retrotransposon gag domain-containing protein n=1 Tax=Microthlaspi erraticum TaxID=1685480 RepID=A0A6D2KUV2_9BRAS|nr:unnamed protein product [Microthlaspi erraticum]
MMLFSTSLAGPALDWAQHEPLSTIESWIDFREAFLKRFARLPPFKSKYHHYSHQLERERDEEEWGGIPPHPEVLNEELIKHVERILSTILLQSVQRSIYATLSSFAMTMDLETTPRRYNFSNYL